MKKTFITTTLAGTVMLTGLTSSVGNLAHADEKTKAGEIAQKNNKGDISKPIDFNEAKKMKPAELKKELTAKDKKILNKETSDEITSANQPQISTFAAPKMRYVASNVNNYIANNNIKPAKIVEDRRIDNLPKYTYKSGKYIGVAIHETANPNSTLDGEVNYMYNNWQNAFVHAYTDYKEIRQTAPADYLAWGSGPQGNAYFYQIELVRAHSFDQFARSVNNQAYLAAYELKRNGLKPKLADNNGGSGTIISHNAISRYYGGSDHTDPISYFSQWGYSMNQFYDLVQKHYNQMSGSTSKGEDQTKSAIKGDTYKVVKGDTIYNISQRSGKSVNDIVKWNNIKNYEIKPGQTLKLKAATSNKITSKVYQVKAKDSLYSISKRSGKSINDIKKWNQLKSNNILVNQKLYLAPTHTVVKGDTLYRIAKNNKITVAKLKALNGLTKDNIKPGDKLILK